MGKPRITPSFIAWLCSAEDNGRIFPLLILIKKEWMLLYVAYRPLKALYISPSGRSGTDLTSFGSIQSHCNYYMNSTQGSFKSYVMPWRGGGTKRYKGVRFNVISVTRGWMGVKFPGKKCYVTFEWPLNHTLSTTISTRSSSIQLIELGHHGQNEYAQALKW